MSTELHLSNNEFKQKFFTLQTFNDLAILLDVPKSKLFYYAFRADLDKHYKTFGIQKKSGGVRKICAPASPLKIIQRKLNPVLQAVYVPKASVHGFVNDRGILSNAKRHLEYRGGNRYVFNIDLKDFFPSINFRRVKGLFISQPYNLPEELAIAIARITCYKYTLPQGSPSSPIISNMICAKMDTQLRRLAQNSRCTYTRYADDITFSTSIPVFPSILFETDEETGKLVLGDELEWVIQTNGFSINLRKVRLQSRHNRQEITGLIVNKFPNVRRKYVRQIRAMLHAWEKYGLEDAEKEYNSKYSKKTNGEAVSFKQVVRGKIEFLRMIRGVENLIYLKFRDKLMQLDPDYREKEKSPQQLESTMVFVTTEGKSDWKHLKAALKRFQENGEYTDLDIIFWEYEDDPSMNDAELLKRCTTGAMLSLDKVHINIFDRDVPSRIKEVNDQGGDYKKWGERLYSFSIPTPSHRLETPFVCIELYYKDSEIKTRDKLGRRLFLSNEFDKKSGRHLSNNLN